MKMNRRERKIYNLGKRDGYLDGYKDGLYDGNPFNALIDGMIEEAREDNELGFNASVSCEVTDPESRENLKKIFEEAGDNENEKIDS